MQNKWRGKVRSPKLIVATILVLVALFAFNQEAIAGVTGKVAGVVRDSETGETLPAANCILAGTDLGAACDVDGDYFIINIPPGTYSLEVRMMGYESVTKTGIEVNVDHTTTVDFELRPVAVAVPGITVSAKREIIKMDVSASEYVTKVEKVTETPLIIDLAEFIDLQAGVEGLEIRGGGIDQTTFMMDGLMMVDNRTNEFFARPNLSSVKELKIIKGGFNAEYGNVRSGVVNIVTKEGSYSEYHGSIDFRYRPPGLKHSGVSIYDPDNFYLRPYLDDDVCWEGTASGAWDEETQAQYNTFVGWNAVSEATLSDDDLTNDRTPQECQDLYIWRHMCEGSDELGRPANEYGNKPDWLVDLGFGGPVPMIRNLSFFTSYRINHETFGLPTNREYYEEDNAQLKLTYRITPSMKLSITGFYGEINSVARVVDAYGDNLYVKGGDGMFQSSLASAQSAYSHRAGSNIYWPSSLTPFDVYKNMQGIAFDHALTPSTFYSLRLTRTYSKNKAIGPDRMRDTTTIRYFGATRVDEAPLGFWWVGGYQEMEDGMLYAAIGAGCRDQSEQDNINFYGDLTSQINKYNQIKLGVIINYDQLYTSYGDYTDYSPTDNTYIEWKHYPIRTGAYIQDKIEFRGIIANIGVRLDYSNPNCEWYTADRYSIYFSKPYKEIFTEICPTEPAKSQLKVSPRFGISHPISEVSKLYFNYGWFYSMAPSSDLYMLGYRKESLGMEFIGNPSADLPRTVAYELGYEHNIAGMFLLHIAGYYKDVSEQTGRVWYTNYDLSVDYWTIENNNYADIRGFEVTLEKPLGSWITGWINYDYKVTTSGFIGRGHYYEDARLQRIYGLQNPYQERPVARPVARADIRLSSPEDWGPTIAGIKPFGGFSLSFIYSWQKGEYFTWDPLETQELRDNVSWVNYSNWDARLSKDVTIGENHIILFMDVRNLLNTKRLHSQGFSDSQDYRNYLESLHLAMYEEEGYEEYTAGNDKPGDIKSENKPYINMPNRDFLTYLDLREVFFGLSFRF